MKIESIQMIDKNKKYTKKCTKKQTDPELFSKITAKKRAIKDICPTTETKKQKKNSEINLVEDQQDFNTFPCDKDESNKMNDVTESVQIVNENTDMTESFQLATFLDNIKETLKDYEFSSLNTFNEWFKSKIVPFLNKSICFIIKNACYLYVLEKNNPAIQFSRQQIQNRFKNTNFIIKYIDEEKKSKTKIIDTFDYWEKSRNRKKYLKMDFEPSNVNPEIYNLFRGFKWKKFKSMEDVDFTKIQPILNHITKVLASDNSYHEKFITEYFADIIQNPGIKNPVNLFFHGKKKRYEKSIITQTLMGALFKNYHIVCQNLENYFNRYNEMFCNKLITVFNEISFEKYYKNNNLKKQMIMNNKIIFNSIEINNYSRNIFEVNYWKRLNIEVNDKRFASFKVSDFYINNTKHFQDIENITKDEDCLTHLFNYFLYYPLTIDFNNLEIIPQIIPKYLLSIKNQSLKFSPIESWLLERTKLVEIKNITSDKKMKLCYEFIEKSNESDLIIQRIFWKLGEICEIPISFLFQDFNFWIEKNKNDKTLFLKDYPKSCNSFSAKLNKILDIKTKNTSRKGQTLQLKFLPTPEDTRNKILKNLI